MANPLIFLISAFLITSCAIDLTPSQSLSTYSEVAGSLMQEANSKETTAEQIEHKARELFQLSDKVVDALSKRNPECATSFKLLKQLRNEILIPDLKKLGEVSYKVESKENTPEICRKAKRIIISPQKIRLLVARKKLTGEKLVTIKKEVQQLLGTLQSL